VPCISRWCMAGAPPGRGRLPGWFRHRRSGLLSPSGLAPGSLGIGAASWHPVRRLLCFSCPVFCLCFLIMNVVAAFNYGDVFNLKVEVWSIDDILIPVFYPNFSETGCVDRN